MPPPAASRIQYGHSAGDLLLTEVATRQKDCRREVDTVVRFGGDVFVVLLGDPDVDRVRLTEHAREVAKIIRASLCRP